MSKVIKIEKSCFLKVRNIPEKFTFEELEMMSVPTHHRYDITFHFYDECYQSFVVYTNTLEHIESVYIDDKIEGRLKEIYVIQNDLLNDILEAIIDYNEMRSN